MVGVVVSETRSETPIAMLSVTANSRNSRPTIPPINNSGMNTATSDTLMETTVKPISAAPLNAAEGANQRERHGDAGNNGGAHGAQEGKHHQDHQNDREQQREFNILHRSPSRDGAIKRNGQLERRGNRGLQVGHQGSHP